MEKTYQLEVNDTGFIIIPRKVMTLLKIKANDSFEFQVVKDELVLEKRVSKCSICNSDKTNSLNKVGELLFCNDCINLIVKDKMIKPQNDNNNQCFVRNIDWFGQISIPGIHRDILHIKGGNKLTLHIYLEDKNKLYLSTSPSKCFACFEDTNLYSVGSYYFCVNCIKNFEDLLKERDIK